MAFRKTKYKSTKKNNLNEKTNINLLKKNNLNEETSYGLKTTNLPAT